MRAVRARQYDMPFTGTGKPIQFVYFDVNYGDKSSNCQAAGHGTVCH
jgi:hypothetical protein